MVKLRKYKNPFILFLADIIILIGAYFISALLRFEFDIPAGLMYRLWLVILVAVFIYMVVFLIFKLYSTLWSVVVCQAKLTPFDIET